MGVDVLEYSGLNGPAKVDDTGGGDSMGETGAEMRPNRFAGWSPLLARAMLAVLLLVLIASALVPTAKPGSRSPWLGPVEGPVDTAGKAVPAAKGEPYDDDIELYEVATARIAAGESYYDFIVPEQRARNYPIYPAIAVRPPTLAYIDAWLGKTGQMIAAIALMLAIVAVWWRRLGEEADKAGRIQRLGTALVFVGASLSLNRHYFPLHELWAGGLMALSFGLHRIGRNEQGGQWVAAFVVAALALAIRELTLPYILLMAAFALWQCNWREATAWVLLVTVFCMGLSWHLAVIANQVLPGDPHGPPWLVMRGMTGWLGNVVQSSNLRWLPHFLAGPAVVLMTFGWLGWRSRSGLFGFLLSAGYGVAFMLAGRWDNFYWGAMIAPAMFAGIVFAPRALAQLAAAARLPLPSRIAAVNRP